MEDEDIEFLWSMLSVDISDRDEALQLLQNIVELWITVRGFSLAGSWMEQYKKENKEGTKKKKALRKTLKKSSEVICHDSGQSSSSLLDKSTEENKEDPQLESDLQLDSENSGEEDFQLSSDSGDLLPTLDSMVD